MTAPTVEATIPVETLARWLEQRAFRLEAQSEEVMGDDASQLIGAAKAFIVLAQEIRESGVAAIEKQRDEAS
jgi:hypothetical protein